MNPIQTLREALEILRGAVGHADTIATADRGLAALAELEKQEPVQLDHIACIDGGELRYMSGRKAPAHDCELYAMPDGKRAPALYAAPVAQQPRTLLEQHDLDQSPEYRKGWDDGRVKGYEVGHRHATEHAAAKAQQPQADDYKGWYCAHCQCGVDGSEVTFHEQHTVCGRVITDDRPPQQPQAEAVPHLFDPKHMLAVFDKARHGSTGPAGFARGIVAVIAEWEAGRGQAEAVPPGYVADKSFRWDGEKQQHIPRLIIEFEPVPANSPCDAQGWRDRDQVAGMFAAAPKGQP